MAENIEKAATGEVVAQQLENEVVGCHATAGLPLGDGVAARVAIQVGGQAVLGRQSLVSTPWLTERHGYDPTLGARIGRRGRGAAA